MNKIFWKELKLVIFDVDGTLYQQSKLRQRMLFELFKYYAVRPWKYKDLVIIHHFRQEREKHAGFEGTNLEELQYQWCSLKVNETLDSVKKVVNRWIFDWPNQYLLKCMYPGAANFIANLHKQGIKTAVYSDYKAEIKLQEMKVSVDICVSSTDKTINSFKPLPNGLSFILNQLAIEDKQNCLFIGDRMELDGLCAKNAGIPFLLVDKSTVEKDFFASLSANLLNAIK